MSAPEPPRRIGSPRWALLEACAATLLAVAAIHLLTGTSYGSVLAPGVWIYIPLASVFCGRRSFEDHGFALSAWRKGWTALALSAVLVLVPFAAAVILLGPKLDGIRPTAPANIDPTVLLLDLVLVAIPEEIFFRGYIHGRLRVWLASRGIRNSIVLAAAGSALFAAAHVLVEPTWIRAAVFVPGLLMGWLRERTGGLLAPTGFHWLANAVWSALRF